MTPTAAPASSVAERALAWTPRSVAALLALTLAAGAVRLFGLAQWSYDAAEAAGWQLVAAPAAAPPPVFAPLGWLLLQQLAAAGVLPTSGEGWLRLPAALAGTLAAPLLAVAVRPLYGVGTALLAAALLTVQSAAVAASQALDPVAIASALAIAAAGAALRGRRAFAAVLAVAAAATAPAALGALAAIALLAAPERFQRVLAAIVGGLAAAAGALALGASAVPLLAFAACGWPLAPRAARLAVGAAVLGAAGSALAGGDGGVRAAAFAAPGLAALAAVGLAAAAAALRGAFAGPTGLVAAAAPALLVLAWLGVDVFLQATVFHGGRTPWRAVADAVWTAADGAPTCVVAAGAGRGSLSVYLGESAASGVAVAPFDPAAGAEAVRALAARPAPAVLLALRSEEQARLDDAARRALADAFECRIVVASPHRHGDDSVAVYRRRAPVAVRPR
jgi:hypothetical protein